MPEQATHVGAIMRTLREAAGLSWTDVEQLTGINAHDLSGLEDGSVSPPSWVLDALLQIPAMADLARLAQEAGLVLPLEDRDAEKKPRAKRQRLTLTQTQREEFGLLLRDRRHAAGLTRLQLAHRAKLSDSTIKFIETAQHPPSRSTLIRLLGIAELRNMSAARSYTYLTDDPAEMQHPRQERNLRVRSSAISSALRRGRVRTGE